MARPSRPRRVARIDVTRSGTEYLLEIEDDAGKIVRFSAGANDALALADSLDDLLADEEAEEKRPG